MNAINRLIDMHGAKSLEADAETQDLILRNNLIWTAHGNLRCLTTAERERLLGFPECVSVLQCTTPELRLVSCVSFALHVEATHLGSP